MRAAQGVERPVRARDGAAQGLVRPERRVEQFLDVVLGLVQVHGHLLLDDLPLLADVCGCELGVEQHVHEHVEQFVEAVVAGAGVETGRLLAGEGVEIAANALDRLRRFPWRTAGGCP